MFQEEANKQDFKEYEGTEYFAFRFPPWVRLLVQEQFYYATFTSLATYFLDEIRSAGDDHIDLLIPHDYVDGKNQGKPEKGGFLLDMKLDAGGQEAQLDELNDRWYIYQQERWFALSLTFSELESAVFVKDLDEDDDPNRIFIFNSLKALAETS